jgi:hypothetical protein
MDNYTFIVTLVDSGLPYPDKESAQKDANEWAQSLGNQELCEVAEVKVQREVD